MSSMLIALVVMAIQTAPASIAVDAPGTDIARHIMVPRIVSDYVTVYRPSSDRFPGPDTRELKAGKMYANWVPNDHAILRGPDQRWHAFGITHPETSTNDVHQGEFQLFHAMAPKGKLADVLRDSRWLDQQKILPPAERPGEILPNHAPYVVKRNDEFWMVYGPSPIRLAVSKDLFNWTPKGPLFRELEGARDPNLILWKDKYIISYCSTNRIRARTSHDLIRWSEPRTILTMPSGIAPESPSIIRFDDTFYLFVCGWDDIWDRKTVQGAYQHRTYVYQSDDPLRFDTSKEVTRIESHAPEIFRDANGQWYISSVEWPQRGLSVAKLVWD